MMLPTHIVLTLLLSICFTVLHPEQTTKIFYVSILAGVFPDLDTLFGQHRKTLHNIQVYSIMMAVVLFCYIIFQTVELFLLLLFFVGCCFHYLTDIISSGLEKEPWNKTSERSVYNHYTHSWMTPKYIISYDGSIEDFVIYAISTLIIIYFYYQISYIEYIVFILTVAAIIYTAIRKKLPQLEDYLYENYSYIRWFLDTLH